MFDPTNLTGFIIHLERARGRASHLKAMQATLPMTTHIIHAIDGNLLGKDDIEITPIFHDALALAYDFAHHEHSGNERYFIRFPPRYREKGKRLGYKNGISLLRPTPVGLGTQMYFLNKPAAERLLAAIYPFDRPIDVTLQMFWQTHVRPLCILPSGIGEISAKLGGSTIQNKKRGIEKWRHEILRPPLSLAHRSSFALFFW